MEGGRGGGLLSSVREEERGGRIGGLWGGEGGN